MFLKKRRTIVRIRQHRAHVVVRTTAEIVNARYFHLKRPDYFYQLQRHLKFNRFFVFSYMTNHRLIKTGQKLTTSGPVMFDLTDTSPENVIFPGTGMGLGNTDRLLTMNGSVLGPFFCTKSKIIEKYFFFQYEQTITTIIEAKF